jgi:Mrp family chromosome partitioning ATPase
VLAVPDARVIAPLVDAVLYCVRWNVTHRDLVRNGLQMFGQIKVRVTGLALTQVDQRKLAKYGYGGYSYYYRSSSRYYLN